MKRRFCVRARAWARRLYYRVKPAIPRGLQLRLRRSGIALLRWRVRRSWPIDLLAAKRPCGWRGWPEEKSFAVVLTHDVEGVRGLGRCSALRQLEEAQRVRSSFNLVSELYETSPVFRDELTDAGFEVGVHGCLHDGRLFESRELFAERAERINKVLDEWNAVGFRAPAMHHDLDLLGELGIRYDLSTYDTDPFEPYGDGVHTIFPFHVPRRGGAGAYLEMPYTLPQDFTLYVLMREKTARIWRDKLDWVAAHGGMALLNTHPDYMRMDGGACGPEEYPVAIYEAFLSYLQTEYGGRFWCALPRQVADHCESMAPLERPVRGKRVCMVAYSFYESDNRVIRYAETLARRGDHVEVVALRRAGAAREQVLNGVYVHGVQERRRNESGKFQYLYRTLKFLLVSSWWLGRESLRERFDVVHVHSVPDFEVFAAWLPKVMGSRIILDIHDLVPEFYAAKFHVPEGSLVYRLLRVIERVSANFADYVIAANHLWYASLVTRAVPENRCVAIPNYIDLNVFSPRKKQLPEQGRFRLIYAGGIQEHQGLDIVLRALARLRADIPGLEFHIYGGGVLLNPLRALAATLELDSVVSFKESVPFHAVPDLLAQADLGVVAKRADGFSDKAFSTKIFEFMSQMVPVIVSRTTVDEYYYADDEVRFFESGNVEELSRAVLELYQDPVARQQLAESGYRCACANSWEARQSEYLDLVDAPCGDETTVSRQHSGRP